jgi:tRNA 2-thiocytidine biosynthesis protein TtcA
MFEEADLVSYARVESLPDHSVHAVAGSQENLQRQEIGRHAARMATPASHGRIETMFSALGRVAPSHLLDRGLFDFAGLVPNGIPDPDGESSV